MKNSDKFLEAFKSIEFHLRKVCKKDKFIPFFDLINYAANIKSEVKLFRDDLKEFSELRNAIVHDKGGGYVIAEPNEEAIKKIEKICSLIIKPPTIFTLFKKKVFTLNTTDPILKAVEIMYKEIISQMPIHNENEFHALLTTNTIARWLGACSEDDIFSLKETTIDHVLQYTEDENNYYFMSRNTSIFEALEKFHEYENKGKRLEAILISDGGKPNEKIIGIMTIADLPKALGTIEDH